MNSQWNTASRTAGIEQQRSGIRFTPMWSKHAVSTLGATFGGLMGGRVDPDDAGGLPYRHLADGDGH
jgi:hypothetical protein